MQGDFRRKATLAEYGSGLPSCLDNRRLRFEEWDAIRAPTIHVSATPGGWEIERTGGVFAEQVHPPTSLLDPAVACRPHAPGRRPPGRGEQGRGRRLPLARHRADQRMAEGPDQYLHENGVRVRYMRSNVDTIERIKILAGPAARRLRCADRHQPAARGLDIPECALVAILDADKEGFLRSETSLIQTIGRAARNVDGKVILYADQMTGSMERAIAETDRRREKQQSPRTSPTGSRRRASSATSATSWTSAYEHDHVRVDTGLARKARWSATT